MRESDAHKRNSFCFSPSLELKIFTFHGLVNSVASNKPLPFLTFLTILKPRLKKSPPQCTTNKYWFFFLETMTTFWNSYLENFRKIATPHKNKIFSKMICKPVLSLTIWNLEKRSPNLESHRERSTHLASLICLYEKKNNYHEIGRE